jgi:hypothetical protein
LKFFIIFIVFLCILCAFAVRESLIFTANLPSTSICTVCI